MPLPRIIADLGTILSSSPPLHVRRLCSSLLSKSLLRDKGINALLTVVFGDEDTPEDALLERFEHVGQILRSIPAGMKPEVDPLYVSLSWILIILRCTSPLLYLAFSASYLKSFLPHTCEQLHFPWLECWIPNSLTENLFL